MIDTLVLPTRPMSRSRWNLGTIVLGLLASASTPAEVARSGLDMPTQATFVIEHVGVLPMTEGSGPILDAVVVIEKGRITSLNGPIPAGASRIDGRGKWLIPGLADMHVHLPSDGHLRAPKYPTEAPTLFFDTQDVMIPYIANGITQLLNMDSVPASIAQRNQIASGTVLGPHIALAAVVNGGFGGGRTANTASDGRQTVRNVKAEGYDFIKVYSDLNVDTYLAIIDEANKRNMKVLGHIPMAFEGQIERAFVAGFSMVAHAEEFSKQSEDFSDADATRFARLAKANGSWVSPTLVVMRWIASQTRSLDEMKASPHLAYMHPLLQSKWLVANRYNRNSSPKLIDYFDRMVVFHRRLVQALKAEGVPMVAGSDTLASGVISGFSLHEELQLLVEAGLTNDEALASATRLPAQWLGVDVDRGTIEIGKRADLVLLEGSPLQDIKNTRRIAGVSVDGRWLDRSQLDLMLQDLAGRYRDARTDFEWDKLTK